MTIGFILFFVFFVLPAFWLIFLIYHLFEGMGPSKAVVKENLNNIDKGNSRKGLVFTRKAAFLLVHSPILCPIRGITVCIISILIYIFLLSVFE